MVRPVVIAATFVLAGGAYAVLRYAPDRYDPFASLAIDAEPSFLTRYKLQRLAGDAAVCFRVLDEEGIEHERVVDETTGDGCGFENAAVLLRSGISWAEVFA